MSRHDLDLTSLIAGLVFALIGGAYLLEAADVMDVHGRWMVPLALIGLGVAGLAGSVLRIRRDRPNPNPDPDPGEPAPDEPTDTHTPVT